ncbi:hypothetical protein GCM10009603_52530 [Nocardiopsis exhalans]
MRLSPEAGPALRGAADPLRTPGSLALLDDVSGEVPDSARAAAEGGRGLRPGPFSYLLKKKNALICNQDHKFL